MGTGFHLILFALQVTTVAVFWIGVVRKHKRMASVYPLYAVRDNFVHLVAAERLKEDDFLFQEFYKAVNIVIPNSKQLTLRTLVSAIEEARKKGHDPAREEWLKRIQNELARLDPEVRNTVASFYGAIIEIFVQNSLVLRAVDILAKCFSSMESTRLPSPTKFQRTTKTIFAEYKTAYSAVAVAA